MTNIESVFMNTVAYLHTHTRINEQRSDRPNKVYDDQIKAIIESYRHVTMREIEEMLKIPKSTIEPHIERFGLVKNLILGFHIN